MDQTSIEALRSYWGVGPLNPWCPATALLLIDMQVTTVGPDGHNIRRLKERGLHVAAEQYQKQLSVAIPNLQRLVQRARENGQPVVYAQLVSMPGRQPGGQEATGRWVLPNSPEAQIIDELAPRPGEIVVMKTGSSAFAGTNLHFLLSRMGITGLIIGGVVTNGCVEYTISNAHDLGYPAVLPSDGSAAATDDLHYDALVRIAQRRAHVMSTESLLAAKIVSMANSLTLS